MARIEYEFNSFLPKADAGYSGNLLDPLQVSVNKALGRYGAVPPYFVRPRADVITQVEDPSKIRSTLTCTGIIHSVMPMRLKRITDPVREWFSLPVEPLVSVSCKNIIARRSIAKSRHKGTVKERWSQDDYEITIQGVLTVADEGAYPHEQLRRLKEFFEERQAVEVEQEMLFSLGITYLALENLNLPHTKGLNNQNYEIKAYSDSPVSLLVPH